MALLFLFFPLSILGAEEKVENILSQSNYYPYSPLIRIPERSLLEQGQIEIITDQSNLKAIAIGQLLKSSSTNMPELPLVSVEQIKLLQQKSKPFESYQLDFELYLINHRKVLRGNIKYFASNMGPENIQVVTFPATKGSMLGDYIFLLSNSGSPLNSLTILSPLTKKCRNLPDISGEDPILNSGVSIVDFIPSIETSKHVYKSIERVSFLVPIEPTKYELRQMQLIKQESLSPLPKRSSSLIHYDVVNGLPYQVQFMKDGDKHRAVILYSWMRLSQGGYLPKEMSYFEEQGNGSFSLITRVSILSSIALPQKGIDFKEGFDKFCALQ